MMDAFRLSDTEPIKLRVIQQDGKWHAQVVRLRDGEIYDSLPMDTREEAVKAAQTLIDNVFSDDLKIQFE